MFLECRFSFRGQLAVEVPKSKNVRTNTDTPLISAKTVHRWDKSETLSSKSKAPSKKFSQMPNVQIITALHPLFALPKLVRSVRIARPGQNCAEIDLVRDE
jgi:hypothetical protein